MRATRTLGGLSAIALVLTFAGCGTESGDGNTTDDTEPATETAGTTIDDVLPPPPSSAIDDVLPEAPAPGELAGAALPTDVDAVIALFDALEEISSVTWGEAGRTWGFTAGAPTEAGRDELIAAFIAAAEQVAAAPAPGPATPDEQAAATALLTLDGLGPDWYESTRRRQARPAVRRVGMSRTEANDERDPRIMTDGPVGGVHNGTY